MKNKKWIIVCIAVLLAVTVLVSCGGKKDDPKSLAKQTLDLTMQLETNPEKALDIEQKLSEIAAKVEKLPLTQQISYASELTKISIEAFNDALNIQIPGDVQSDLRNLATDALNAGDVQDALRAMNSELESATNEINDALNALRSLGF